ncbi:phenylacetyl-CoA ligase [Obba rivulosa]|uniref:Phenylacetyl-CoA ligase n=1 Tax=Obba rivulosa TaxID=1052685 RepID=A0A8E2J4T2_9APHY|nr:phenylacetyl-CoA ligase [Obba rivulosa]
MSEIHGPDGLPYIPDDLTVAQFMLDSHHPTRPIPKHPRAWLIEDATGRQIYYDEIRARVSGLANALKLRRGIGEDDVVCIFSPNHVDYPVAIWAIHRLGAIITPANPSYTKDELEYQLNITKAKAILVHPANYAVAVDAARTLGISPDNIILFDPLPDQSSRSSPTIYDLIADGLSQPPSYVERRLRPGEGKTKIAFLSLSSGTTGRPKAVCIPHIAPIANCIQMAYASRVNEEYTTWEDRRYRPGDVELGVLPFYHIYGLVVIMHGALFSGMTLVVIPKFNFTEMLKSVQRYRINHMKIVPPMVVLLCKHPATRDYDLSSVKMVMSGAAPLSAELIQQLRERLPDSGIAQAYGMTETSTTVSWPNLYQKIGTPGSSGLLIPGAVARVVKDDGSLAKYGEPGQLVVRTPSQALGYLNNEEATKETFKDGWVYTGDEVIINEQKELYIIDRIKELIKVKGFQVAPAELEGHLLDHPDVTDVCVVGVPDDYSGELPLAYVVLSADAQARVAQDPAAADTIRAALIKHVSDHKVRYKWLTGGVEFIEAIPKNPSGKLLRRFLRDRAKELRAGKAKAKL